MEITSVKQNNYIVLVHAGLGRKAKVKVSLKKRAKAGKGRRSEA